MNYSNQLSTNTKFYIFVVWCLLRLVDFTTGYVEYSFLRAAFSIILGILFLVNIPLLGSTKIYASRIFFKYGEYFLVFFCSLFGYYLFISRFLRKANMGETLIFKESIENTALYGGWLWNQYEGVSHFAYHNSPGLFIFVPLVWMFGKYSWFLISFLQSFSIVLSNYIIGIKFTKSVISYNWALVFFVALYLSMYIQHVKFIETRFAMLGLALFIYGLLSNNQKLNIGGFLICLLFRETVIIPCMLITLFTYPYPFSKNTKYSIFLIGTLWCIFSIYLVNELNPEGIYGNGFSSTGIDLLENLPLKFAHLLRLVSMGPLIIWSLPGIIGLLTELSLVFLSSHDKFYHLGWHLWIIPGTIITMYSIDVLKKKYNQSIDFINYYFKFVSLTLVWQFITTFHPRLY